MSKETLEYHWGKHHRGYVDNLNKQIVGTELDGLTLEGVVLVSYNKGDILPAFNNAAQVGNILLCKYRLFIVHISLSILCKSFKNKQTIILSKVGQTLVKNCNSISLVLPMTF